MNMLQNGFKNRMTLTIVKDLTNRTTNRFPSLEDFRNSSSNYPNIESNCKYSYYS